MPVTDPILRSLVAVVAGVGNAVDELSVQLTSLWLDEGKRYDRLGRILEVVRNVPDRAGVLVRSQTVETRAGGLRDVGLLTPGQGMPGA